MMLSNYLASPFGKFRKEEIKWCSTKVLSAPWILSNEVVTKMDSEIVLQCILGKSYFDAII
jgi:hypothetical protein